MRHRYCWFARHRGCRAGNAAVARAAAVGKVFDVSCVSQVSLAQGNQPCAFVQDVACVEAAAIKRKDGQINKFGPNGCSRPELRKQLVINRQLSSIL